MFKTLLLFVIIPAVFATPVFAQFEQMQRKREKIERSIREDEERQRAAAADAASNPVIPKPKPAVMNVDVQAVMTRAEYRSFAEAKPNAVRKVTDGEPLWLHVKFNGKLGDYVYAYADPEQPGKIKYALYAEVGPQGDVISRGQYLLQFTKEELAAGELKLAIAPAIFGRNRSIPVFLTAAASSVPGVWASEIRLANTNAVPRSPDAYLSKIVFTMDLKGGVAKYRTMASDYDSIIIRGSTDLAKLPVEGTFFNSAVAGTLADDAKARNITPAKIYFSGDDWMVTPASVTAPHDTRKIFATLTYQRDGACYYEVAAVTQVFDRQSARWGEQAVKAEKAVAVPCGQP